MLGSLAEAINSDPERRRILIVEMAHLPDSTPEDVDGARKDALRTAVAGFLADCEEVSADNPCLTFASASIVEVIRSTELTGGRNVLPARLTDLQERLAGISAAPARPLAA